MAHRSKEVTFNGYRNNETQRQYRPSRWERREPRYDFSKIRTSVRIPEPHRSATRKLTASCRWICFRRSVTTPVCRRSSDQPSDHRLPRHVVAGIRRVSHRQLASAQMRPVARTASPALQLPPVRRGDQSQPALFRRRGLQSVDLQPQRRQHLRQLRRAGRLEAQI